MQKNQSTSCEKFFLLAVKRSGGISTALKFSLRTLKECHYYQVLLHVFWQKLIFLCCFMLAHFVQQTLRNLLSSSISLLISCFFPKIRKLLCLNHCLGNLGNQLCSKGTSLKSGPGSKPLPKIHGRKLTPVTETSPHLTEPLMWVNLKKMQES